MLQVEHDPDEQEEQGEPPTGVLKPSAPLLKDENTESTRSASSWPLGQVAGSSERLIERKSSNLVSQRPQKYS
jgi:hypothetical protein